MSEVAMRVTQIPILRYGELSPSMQQFDFPEDDFIAANRLRVEDGKIVGFFHPLKVFAFQYRTVTPVSITEIQMAAGGDSHIVKAQGETEIPAGECLQFDYIINANGCFNNGIKIEEIDRIVEGSLERGVMRRVVELSETMRPKYYRADLHFTHGTMQ